MPTARYYLGVATASNGKLYAVGGFGGRKNLTTVEEYDPATDRWTTKPSMFYARQSGAVAAASNGKVYAVGGFDGNMYLAAVEEFDPMR